MSSVLSLSFSLSLSLSVCLARAGLSAWEAQWGATNEVNSVLVYLSERRSERRQKEH